MFSCPEDPLPPAGARLNPSRPPGSSQDGGGTAPRGRCPGARPRRLHERGGAGTARRGRAAAAAGAEPGELWRPAGGRRGARPLVQLGARPPGAGGERGRGKFGGGAVPCPSAGRCSAAMLGAGRAAGELPRQRGAWGGGKGREGKERIMERIKERRNKGGIEGGGGEEGAGGKLRGAVGARLSRTPRGCLKAVRLRKGELNK